MLKRILEAGMALVLAVMTLTIVAVLGATPPEAVDADGAELAKTTGPVPGPLYVLTGDDVVETALIRTAPTWGRLEEAHLFDLCAAMLPSRRTRSDRTRIPPIAGPWLHSRVLQEDLRPGIRVTEYHAHAIRSR